MISLDGDRAAPSDRATVEGTAQELIHGMIRRRTPVGVSVVIEGAPGIGKTFLAREILASVAPSQAKVLRVAGQQGRRNDPFAAASQLLGDLCPPEVSGLVRGTLAADPDAIGEAADELAGAGRLTAEAFAREELACAAAAAGDRDRATAALDEALTGYQRIGAVPDRDRALARTRALGIRRSSREPHRDADYGWAALTATEARIASLVRDGLTNREIGTRLFVSPRTMQTHVSHILQKTGLRSRVEIARFAGA